MRLIAHLSDLHFGAIDLTIASALAEYLQREKPDIVVVSGDFTQRARRKQFADARVFLDSLPGEKVVVPGNHDVPAWNPFARFIRPLTNYRRFITSDLAPTFSDGEVAIIGINTARALTHKNGRINSRQAEDACKRLRDVPADALKIVVTHHPFDLAETFGRRMLVGRARMAMQRLAEGGAEVLLAGHWHEAYTGGTANRYPLGDYSALVVQAGTATSTRTRLSSNSFNLLRYEPPFLTVEIMTWESENRRFTLQEARRFRRRPTGGFEGA